MKALIKKHWCELLPHQLQAEDYDSIEKVLAAISASAKDCIETFNEAGLRTNLLKVKDRFLKEINEEDDKDFKSYLETFPERIDKIINEVGKSITL